MRKFIFVKYRPKLSMQWLENNYKKYQKHPFRNPYNDNMIIETLYKYTVSKGYMCDDYRAIKTIFYRSMAQLKDISDNVSSMRSLNFSSYKPIN